MQELRESRGRQARVAGEARRERPARGPAPRARPGPVDPRPVRGDRRPRPPQGRPGALPAVADQPAAARVRASWPSAGAPYDDESFRAEIRAVARAVQPGPAARRGGLALVRRADPLPPPRLRRRRRRSTRLATRLDELDEEHGTRGNRLFYLATQPSQFAEIVAQLGRVGLDHERHDGGWRRVVIEKPFGHDLDSAKRLNREVGKVFRESQVYRIDHYLGKETVRNLLVFRFGNGIFEPLWNRRYVDHVQITVAESIGIENRGAFYEETGRVARRPPEPPPPAGQPRRDGAAGDVRGRRRCATRRSRSCAPSATHPADPVDRRRPRPVRPGLGRRRRQVPGYREEPEVDPASETETFVAARLDDRRLALVRRPVLRPDRQAAAEAGDRDRDPVPRGPAPPVPRRRRSTRTRTCWRSGSSRTRGSCCASGPRSRASAWTSGR